MSETAIALGYFDGVHLGHRRILRVAVESAGQFGLKPVAFTFYFDNRRTKGPDILTLSERKNRILHQGIEEIICPPFSEIAALTPEQFVGEVLYNRCQAKVVCCGDNFRFGVNGSGDVRILQELCAAYGIRVNILPLTLADGVPVSATRIRLLLAQGDIEAANKLLGQPYCIDLPVQHGQQLGRSMGFPTANQIYLPTMQQPMPGVWRTAIQIDGKWYPAATGLGGRPTVSEEGAAVTCESYICNWQGDIYGKEIRLAFLEYLWPVRKYDSLQQLQQCIRTAALLSCERFHPGDAEKTL